LVGRLSRKSTDLQIVDAALERWGTNAFAALIGDWAVSVWNPKDQSLVLAKDFIGTRHLFYSLERERGSRGARFSIPSFCFQVARTNWRKNILRAGYRPFRLLA
jgi:asparagine synthetase B (glutamine-hydrolysing)